MSTAPTPAEVALARHMPRNFWLNVVEGSGFTLGISMISRYTVLPLFVDRLSSAPWLQGLIPTIFYLGWLLPGLFMAPVVASMPRRKPWMLRTTFFERFAYLLLGLVLLLAPNQSATHLLVIFFILFFLYSLSAGLTSTAWQDFIARIIPERRWGTFFGLQSGIGGVLGVVGASIATSILATQPFPQSVGLLSMLCFGCMAFSYILLSLTIEPAQETAPRQPFRTFLGGIMPLLRRDHSFRRYLFCRTAIALGLVGHSFVTASALARFALPNATIGLFTVALLGSQALANLGLGYLSDRWGHKQILELSTALGLLALIAAPLAPAPLWFVPVFMLVGAAQAGYMLSGFTLVFAFSTPTERPTYIGVANTALAPAAALGPLLAGGLASVTNYTVLFVVLTMIGALGLLGLHYRVTAPARVRAEG